MRRTLAIVGFIVGTVALVVQFFAVTGSLMDAGRGLIGSVVFYFTYFTILTNLVLVLIYLGALVRGKRWLVPFRRPVMRAGAAAAITLVMVYYAIFLHGLYADQSQFWLANIALHYISPVIYLIWFAGWNRSGTVSYGSIPVMMSLPALYLAYVLLRGALTGEYPYPMLDADALGYYQVLQNIAGLAIAFAVLSAAAIFVDRALIGREVTR